MRLWVLAGLLLMVPIAVQADTLTYLGETSSYTSYVGGSPILWDYVYRIDSLSGSTASWGIVCPVAPVNIFTTPEWTVSPWHIISASDGLQVAELWGKPGIVWRQGAFPNGTEIFHFQTALPVSPTMQAYDGDGWTGGTQYSANPEPGSLILLGIAMAGGGFWRRRRTARK